MLCRHRVDATPLPTLPSSRPNGRDLRVTPVDVSVAYASPWLATTCVFVSDVMGTSITSGRCASNRAYTEGGRGVLTGPAAVFVLITCVGVAVALVSFRVGMPRAYVVSKASASLGFIGTALAAGAMDSVWGRLALGGLVLSAAGDVVLSLRGRRAFLSGMACFAAAYMTYSIAFVFSGVRVAALGATAPAVAATAAGVWIWLRTRLPEPLRIPVGAYVGIVAVMLAVGTAAGITHRSWMLFCGVILVAGSDIAVGRERFDDAGFENKLLGLPAYYAGQTLIALSLSGV